MNGLMVVNWLGAAAVQVIFLALVSPPLWVGVIGGIGIAASLINAGFALEESS